MPDVLLKQEFTYSQEGDRNLQTIARSDNFCDWMYSVIRPHLHGNILEVGSGIGTYSERIARDFPEQRIFLSDIDEAYVKELRDRFSKSSNIRAVKLDLTEKTDFSQIGATVNSAFALNVMEHIENDVLAFRNVYDLLEPGGTYVVLVPAHAWLYNVIDKAIHHFRRYDRPLMRSKIAQTDFRIERMFYFNFLSILGWYVNGNILKRELINEGAMGLFNKLVPILRPVEKHLLRRKIGLSLVAVLRKD